MIVSDVGAQPQEDERAPETDAELDALEAAFESVDAALTALDADDLDGAEALAASLADTGSVEPTDPPSSTED